jgi:dolichol-phosphate mannosyltransferase
MTEPHYSFVVPVLNEQETLDELIRRLQAVMNSLAEPSEVVLVDDGSTDGSYDLMLDLRRRDPRIKALRLTRNFGHQMAITAGLDHALGRAVIIMDGDLQDPPEVALELIQRWREGYDVVYAVRDTRAGESWLKRKTAKAFYRLMSRLGDIDIPQEAGDFRLVDRQAVDAVTAMREPGSAIARRASHSNAMLDMRERRSSRSDACSRSQSTGSSPSRRRRFELRSREASSSLRFRSSSVSWPSS